MTRLELDFLVIGSQKAGTTSLFEYVRTHPGIYLPPEKEVPYFNLQARLERGWPWFVDWVFHRAPEDRVWGLFSTFYMDGTEGPEPTIQERIHQTIPDVKLIAILRDPVERALSHHRMSAMKRMEHASFEDAVAVLLEEDTLAEARREPTETNSYVVRGEYGRILSRYRELFPEEQMLVLYTEELAADPRSVLRSTFEYVGVDPGFVPPNLERRYREGGDERRLKWLDPSAWRVRLAAYPPAKRAWRTVPHGPRRFADHWLRLAASRLELWNAHRGTDAPAVDPAVVERLRSHYRPDIRLLEALTGRAPPWV